MGLIPDVGALITQAMQEQKERDRERLRHLMLYGIIRAGGSYEKGMLPIRY